MRGLLIGTAGGAVQCGRSGSVLHMERETGVTAFPWGHYLVGGVAGQAQGETLAGGANAALVAVLDESVVVEVQILSVLNGGHQRGALSFVDAVQIEGGFAVFAGEW